MTFEDLTKKILLYRVGRTQQSWRKDEELNYSNEYICLLRIDSSNKSGGNKIIRGKQWSIIIEIKKDFCNLPNWKKFITLDFVKLTPVKGKAKYAGNFGIRFYNMSQNPSNELVKDILEFIFENK